MASIVERPYTIKVPPPAQTGLMVTPSSECNNLDDCGPFAASFNVTLRMFLLSCFHSFSSSFSSSKEEILLFLSEAYLDYAPTTAYPPVLFASVSHPNQQWWVAGVAHTPLSELDQEWTISGGCFGSPVCNMYLIGLNS